MGVPAFFRWLEKKYPSIVVEAKEDRQRNADGTWIPIDSTQPNPNFQEFDNLYLDMNGIIHPCTHPENSPAPENENEMFALIFEYIDRVFAIVRPRKLLYMAIDGVAPRAKMNQQRTRRFRASKEASDKEAAIEERRRRLVAAGKPLPPKKEAENQFDSNCITPGTPFMARLADALRYYIHDRITNDPAWAKIQVILSDANVPGEGEHKIMDFIRKQRANSAHNPDTVHCLCGADADLIMLGLATHEANFNIIREEFIPNQQPTCQSCGKYGHELKSCRGPENESSGEDHADPLQKMKDFIFVRLPVLREYLEKEMAMPNLPFTFDLERVIDDWVFLCFFVGNDFVPHLPSLEIREGAIDRLIKLYKETVKEMNGYMTKDGEVDMEQVQKIMIGLGKVENEIFQRRRAEEERFRQRKIKWQGMNDGGRGRGQTDRSSYAAQATEYSESEETTITLKTMLKIEGTSAASACSAEHINRMSEVSLIIPKENAHTDPVDEIRLYEAGWKDRYYRAKFDVGPEDMKFRETVAWAYVKGLCWVLKYYYQGCASWDWYFPYHYAPFASDFNTIINFKPDFTRPTKPFKPLEQLMSVFPAASKQHLPLEWQKLMTEDDSPIIDLYPNDFHIDLNGKKLAWQGVALLPFVDEARLLKALQQVYPSLTEEEKARNTIGPNRLFIGRHHPAFKFFLRIYHEDSQSKTVEVDPAFTYGVTGTISTDTTAVLLNSTFPSPVCDPRCPDLPVNGTLGVLYDDPSYPEGHIFPATRLETATAIPRTLKPGDWNDRSVRNGWAYVDQSGNRNFNHEIRNADGFRSRGNCGYGWPRGRGGGYNSCDNRGSRGGYRGGYNSNDNRGGRGGYRGGYNSNDNRGRRGEYRGGYNSNDNRGCRGGYRGGYNDGGYRNNYNGDQNNRFDNTNGGRGSYGNQRGGQRGSEGRGRGNGGYQQSYTGR